MKYNANLIGVIAILAAILIAFWPHRSQKKDGRSWGTAYSSINEALESLPRDKDGYEINEYGTRNIYIKAAPNWEGKRGTSPDDAVPSYWFAFDIAKDGDVLIAGNNHVEIGIDDENLAVSTDGGPKIIVPKERRYEFNR